MWSTHTRVSHHDHVHFHGQDVVHRIQQRFTFFTELVDAEKLITSADNRFWAGSKESRVRVEFSKTFAMVTSRSEGTFLMGWLMTFEVVGCFEKSIQCHRR